MHAILLIDEIISKIFKYSADDGLATLCSVGRCCRAWNEPAIDILWKYLIDFQFLLRLIPQIEIVGGAYNLPQDIDSINIDAFMKYAKRVTHIHCPQLISFTSFASSALIPVTESAFQRLSSMHVTSSAVKDPVIRHLITNHPGLRVLSVRLSFKRESDIRLQESHVVPLVDSVGHRLERLSICGGLSFRLLDTVASMDHLRALSLRTGKSLTPEALTSIIVFPRLEELEIHAAHIDCDSIETRSSERLAFPALRTLKMRVNPSLAEWILRFIQCGTLQTLHLEIQSMEASPDDSSSCWCKIYTIIASKVAFSLRELVISDRTSSQVAAVRNDPSSSIAQSPEMTIPPEIYGLRHFTALTSLERLTLDFTGTRSLNDTDVGEIVRICGRKLKHLDLGLYSDEDIATSMNCLPNIADGCPSLDTLVISIDPNASSALPPEEAESPSSCALRKLIVGFKSLLKDPESTSRLLRRIFPSLEEVHGSNTPEPDFH